MDTSDPILPATCLVLAGGQARRFGSDKLAAELGRLPLLSAVVGLLSPWFEDTIVVHAPGPDLVLTGLDRGPGRADETATGTSSIRQTADLIAGGGPLCGLVAGLAACATEWAFVAAGDMPFVSRALVDLMWARTGSGAAAPTRAAAASPTGPDIVIVRGPRGFEPLGAFYRAAVLPYARAAADAGKRRVISFFDEVTVDVVDEAEARRVDPDLASFFNINTVDDLAAARESLVVQPLQEPQQP